MNFNKRKINNVLKLATAYNQAVISYVKFAQDSFFNKISALNNAIKDLAQEVKLVNPSDKDMASLVRSGNVLLDDFQTMNLPAEHIATRLQNMNKHLQVVQAFNYYIEEEDIYEGGVNRTVNHKLLQKVDAVFDKLGEVKAALGTYKVRTGPVVPRKSTPKPAAPKPTQTAPMGQAFVSEFNKTWDKALETEKARILSEVDSGEYDLEDMSAEVKNSTPLSQKALRQLREEQKQFGFAPESAGASEEELGEVVTNLMKDTESRY